MNGVVVKMVGSKLVVEVDILKAIAEGVGGARQSAPSRRSPSPRLRTRLVRSGSVAGEPGPGLHPRGKREIRLRKIDGWRKIATVLRQHTPRAA